MFQIDEDMTIYVTRGDVAFFRVSASNNGVPYKFKAGDVVRMKVMQKKKCENVAFQKDFPVLKETEKVEILLTAEETKIGDVISKPVDYWYEVELNPYTNPQTIIGYDDDGAKIFKLFPEGRDLGTTPILEEDIPVVDSELSLTSDRPIQNQAVARAIVAMNDTVEKTTESTLKAMEDTKAEVDKEIDDNAKDIQALSAKTSELKGEIAVERARINNLTRAEENGMSTDAERELADIRVGTGGTVYKNAGEAVRGQLNNLTELSMMYRGSVYSNCRYNKFAQCLERGYYGVHTTMDLPYITDKPSDAKKGGLLNVDVAVYGNTTVYIHTFKDIIGNIWYKVFDDREIPSDNVEWKELINSDVYNQVKELLNNDGSENYIFRGSVYCELGYTQLADCTESGTYWVHTIRDLEHITDIPDGMIRGGLLYVDLLKYSNINQVLLYQTIIDINGNVWRRAADLIDGVVKPTEWLKISVNVNNDIIPLIDSKIASIEKNTEEKFYFLHDLIGMYQTPNTIEGGSTSDSVNLTSSNVNVIYDIFDNLCTAYPEYVSKTTLGTVGDLAINQYTFDYIGIENNSAYSNKKIKILLNAGIHGYEQGSSWCTTQFFKLLCENVDNDILNFMKYNVCFVVVPVSNPFGFNNNVRKNASGVDINRNFDAQFVVGRNPNDDYYPGLSANSEVETQILSDWIEANKDADWVIDYHNIAGGYPLFYLYNDEQVRLCNSVFSALTPTWKKNYSGFPTNQLLGYCKAGMNACFSKYAIKQGLKSFILETPWTMPVIGKSQYDKNTIITGVDVLANTLVAILKSYK